MPHISNNLALAGLMLTASQAGIASTIDSSMAAAGLHRAAVVVAESAKTDGDVRLREGDVLSRLAITQRGIGIGWGVAVWEDGIVPFYIDPELESSAVANVNTAIDTWNKVAGISLIAIDPHSADSPTDYIHFIPANGCASWIGRQGGAQPVWTAPSCSSGSMMHEIGHALGLEHEHTRPDRDQYIDIVWDNISSEKVRNFDISQTGKQNYGPYDYASIMHYGEYFFSANGGPTIRALSIDNADNRQMGQRVSPSVGDIDAISALYACDLSLVTNVVTNQAGQSEVSLLVTNEYLQGANHINIELDVGTALLLDNSNSEWQCETTQGTLTCNKDRLSGGAQSQLVLLLDEHRFERDLNPRLATKTPDDNLANNNGVFSAAAAQAIFADNSEPDNSDRQLQASAGGLSVWIFGLLVLLLGRVHCLRTEHR